MSNPEFVMVRMEGTLMHEIGHNLGITHHGGENNEDLWCEFPKCSIRYTKESDFRTDTEIEDYFVSSRYYCKDGRFNCYGQIDVKSDP